MKNLKKIFWGTLLLFMCTVVAILMPLGGRSTPHAEKLDPFICINNEGVGVSAGADCFGSGPGCIENPCPKGSFRPLPEE